MSFDISKFIKELIMLLSCLSLKSSYNIFEGRTNGEGKCQQEESRRGERAQSEVVDVHLQEHGGH